MVRGRPSKLALAIVLIAAHVAASTAIVEHLGTRHVVCVEHGELIDVPIAASDDAAAGDDDSLGARGERPRLAEHTHCALAPADDDAIAPSPCVVLDTPAPIVRAVAVAHAIVTPRPTSVLSVAPKTSPPG